MLTKQRFKDLTEAITNGISLRPDPDNPGTPDAVLAPAHTSQFLVAGPGSGKTTALTLRLLKLIFVDDLPPESIFATTFTRKAAAELMSRILEYGLAIRETVLAEAQSESDRLAAEQVDFNKLRVGTLDSLAQDLLQEYRSATDLPPTVVEGIARNALMLRRGLFEGGRHQSASLGNYMKSFHEQRVNGPQPRLTFLNTLRDRLTNDLVDVDRYRKSLTKEKPDLKKGATRALDAIDAYSSALEEAGLLDFAKLERHFLEQLDAYRFSDFLKSLKIILVDEYQDTNPLQESIYLRLARSALANGGGISVVGDDDQSMYRFRGATVELFREFPTRAESELGLDGGPRTIFLSKNYRSTPSIVEFVNEFVKVDPKYLDARVEGKPHLIAARDQGGDYPIFTIFRDSVQELSQSITAFVEQLVNGDGHTVVDREKTWHIELDPAHGSANDIALLAGTVRETNASGNYQLVGHLRRDLSELTPQVKVYNPRGQEPTDVQAVMALLGLVIQCIDPDAKVQHSNDVRIGSLSDQLDEWRHYAREARAQDRDLSQFVTNWQERRPTRSMGNRREERVAIVDLVYKLLRWFPIFRSDVEYLTYLEAITRTVNDAALFSSFDSEIIFDPKEPKSDRAIASIRDAYYSIFAPIAGGALALDEDLLETLPADRLNIMTIHQSKGLEFPVTLVDVGSAFRSRHWTQEFKRFPDHDSQIGLHIWMEDHFGEFATLKPSRRSSRDRAFDDLVRQYFVGFSRAQDILVLVGHSKCLEGRGIPNVATGWRRDNVWPWKGGIPGAVALDL